MARIFPLLVVLLFGLAVAFKPKGPPPDRIADKDLPPPARKRVMEFRAELGALLTDACKRLLYVIREIAWARRCIFRGLPVAEYLRIKAICKNRSELLDGLRAYRMRCNSDPTKCDEKELKWFLNARQKAVRACNRIGWDGDGKDCPNLKALQEEFERTKNACRGKVDRIKELREKIRNVKNNFVRPSVDPVARFDL